MNFENLRDMGAPVELARHYAAQGADEITFLDVTATVDARATTYDVVQRTAEQVFVPLTVGGGVRSVDDVARLLAVGADKVGVNSAAIARPELIGEIADRFGGDTVCTIAGMHCESGDILVRDATLDDPRPGDVLVIPVTGAYGHAMANNYNAVPRPPVIFCSGGDARVVVRRETYEDLTLRDV